MAVTLFKIKAVVQALAFVRGMVEHVTARILFRERDLHFLLCACDAFDGLDDDDLDTAVV